LNVSGAENFRSETIIALIIYQRGWRAAAPWQHDFTAASNGDESLDSE